MHTANKQSPNAAESPVVVPGRVASMQCQNPGPVRAASDSTSSVKRPAHFIPLATVVEVQQEGKGWLVAFDCQHIVLRKHRPAIGLKMYCAVCLEQAVERVQRRVKQ